MAGQVRLTDADRARISAEAGVDVPEWLDIDVLSVTNREAVVLTTLGFRTPFLWRRAMASGEDDETLSTLDDLLLADTLPEAAVKVVAAARTRLAELQLAASTTDAAAGLLAWTGLVWLALKRAGVTTDPATLEFDLDGLSTRTDKPGQSSEPGKESGSGPTGTGGPG